MGISLHHFHPFSRSTTPRYNQVSFTQHWQTYQKFAPLLDELRKTMAWHLVRDVRRKVTRLGSTNWLDV